MKKIIKFFPKPIKSTLRLVYYFFDKQFRKITTKTKSRSELFKYWQNPNDGNNLAEYYILPAERSDFLLKIIKKYTGKNDSILEIGCNAGRNLKYLFDAGYRNLAGVEISKRAVKFMKETYPEMAHSIKVYNKPAEEMVKILEPFDVIFTMATLQHIHPDSEFVFSEIVKLTRKYLILIEDEGGITWRHFRRNYKKIFEKLGLRQVEELNCRGVGNFDPTYWLRVFKK